MIFDPDVYPMDKAWLTGNTSADHVRETRPEYYLALVRKQEEQEAREEREEADGSAPDGDGNGQP